MQHNLTFATSATNFAYDHTIIQQVCLVRMQADGRLPPAQRRGYTNIFNALRRIAVEEGVLTYWRGASPTVTRAMVVSMTQLGTYDQIKSMLLPHTGDTAQTHVISALTAAVVYSLASLPVSALLCTAQLYAVYEM
jgi:solute carrier family 25 (mitochondrial oxoglutarate transporter), member 11